MTSFSRQRAPALLALVAGMSVLGACSGTNPPEQLDVVTMLADDPPPPGLGAPCLPSDEIRTDFAGFSRDTLSLESIAGGLNQTRCGSATHCLVDRFQGRVSCPYGQTAETAAVCLDTQACREGSELFDQSCHIAGADASRADSRVSVAVQPQFVERQGEDAVYCTCRCAGSDPKGSYCACPLEYECKLLGDSSAPADLQGSYCVRKSATLPTSASTTCLLGTRDKDGGCGNDGKNP